jgi:hypothetical protein
MTPELIERSNTWAATIGPGWNADTSYGHEHHGALYIINGRVSLRKIAGNEFRYKYPNGEYVSATINKKCCSDGATYQEALEGLMATLLNYHPEIAYSGLDNDVAAITRALSK